LSRKRSAAKKRSITSRILSTSPAVQSNSHSDLFTRPIVITSADFRFVVAEQLRERGVEADIVLKLMRRDSGLAVAVSALLAAERDRDAFVLVLSADHVVRKPYEFREACQRAPRSPLRGGSSPSASSPPIRVLRKSRRVSRQHLSDRMS
jgi:mannose-1-phosphate guanylyltransferase